MKEKVSYAALKSDISKSKNTRKQTKKNTHLLRLRYACVPLIPE